LRAIDYFIHLPDAHFVKDVGVILIMGISLSFQPPSSVWYSGTFL
jgi:hypothetical protein